MNKIVINRKCYFMVLSVSVYICCLLSTTRLENNISCLYFHLRCEEASKPVVRVGGGRFLSESRPCPQHCMEILHSSDSGRHITEQSTVMTQSFLCFIVLILFSTLFSDGLTSSSQTGRNPQRMIVMRIFLKILQLFFYNFKNAG